ncbi:MAG: hypothetical protein OEZ06_12420 [Myxococcales bacterium]|nr:hypothetical protein [Myxococcales bacterium]
MNRLRTLRARSRACLALFCMAAIVSCGGGDEDGRTGSGGLSSGGTGTGFGNPESSGASGAGSGFGNPTATVTGTADNVANEPCASANVRTTRAQPTIEFVVDGSGSMCAVFGPQTRWTALRSALLDPVEGLIYRLQQTVVFGSVIYDGTIDQFLALGAVGTPSPPCASNYLQMKAAGECPQLVDVPPALNNAAAIDAGFPQVELGGSTPTDRALMWTMDRLIEQQVSGPDTEMEPQYVILATDGAPNDICVGGLGGDGSIQRQNVLAEVDRGAANGIRTFVISLAGNDPNLQAHLDEVARHGDPGNPNAVTYNPTNKADLVSALAKLVGGAVGCDIFLDNGTVKAGSECTGEVTLSGNHLPCCTGAPGAYTCDGVPMADANGWRLKDERTLELMGLTCLDFLNSTETSLLAEFPCGVFVPD